MMNHYWTTSALLINTGCKCGTWKEHWLNYGNGEWPRECSAENCREAAQLGAHIQSSSVYGARIVPLCINCIARSDFFKLTANSVVVVADEAKTCRCV